MEILFSIIVVIAICSLMVWVAYLQTELNIAEDKIEDLEFLNDLRK